MKIKWNEKKKKKDLIKWKSRIFGLLKIMSKTFCKLFFAFWRTHCSNSCSINWWPRRKMRSLAALWAQKELTQKLLPSKSKNIVISKRIVLWNWAMSVLSGCLEWQAISSSMETFIYLENGLQSYLNATFPSLGKSCKNSIRCLYRCSI